MHLIEKIIFVLRKKTWGCHGGHLTPDDTSHYRGCQGPSDAPHDAPMLFFDNLVKKLDNLSTSNSNIDIYPSTLEICINNLLKTFFLWIWTTPLPPDPTTDHPTPPKNHTNAQYFQ